MPGKSRFIERFSVETGKRSQMVDITDRIEAVMRRHELREAQVVVYIPHTTAGVTIQENADPDVQHDLLAKLDALIPKEESYYRHAEGNSDSHLKTVLTGTSQTLFYTQGRLLLGRWQGVYLCEFDGPRTRDVVVQVVPLEERNRGD